MDLSRVLVAVLALVEVCWKQRDTTEVIRRQQWSVQMYSSTRSGSDRVVEYSAWQAKRSIGWMNVDV